MTRTKELLEEFGREAAGTRRLLELVPQKHLAWKPHEKSMSIGRLAGHVAEIPGWAVTMTECDELDLAAGPFYQPFEPASLRGLLVEFGSRVSDFNGALLAARDADLDVTWTLRRGDRVIAALTRGLALRQLVLNHLVHHRGQLSVYLRLLEVSLPQVYGPTADHAEFTVVESESRRTSGRMLFEELAYAL
ncbi:MAG TPA: DinB family protein [Thermoanaerobaculia bacterium]|jgi:uncharacterized damage-inducible protein DinB